MRYGGADHCLANHLAFASAGAWRSRQGTKQRTPEMVSLRYGDNVLDATTWSHAY